MNPHVHHHNPITFVVITNFEKFFTQVFRPCDRTLITPIANGSHKSLIVFGFASQSFWTTAKESVTNNAPCPILIRGVRTSVG